MNINDLTPAELEKAKKNAQELEKKFQEAKQLMAKKQVAEANLILAGLLRKLESLDNSNLNKLEIICSYGETLLYMDKQNEGKNIIRCCMVVWELNGSERAINLLNNYRAIWKLDQSMSALKPFKPKLTFMEKIKNAIAKPAAIHVSFPNEIQQLANSKYPL